MKLRADQLRNLKAEITELDRRIPRKPNGLLEFLTRSELHTLLRWKKADIAGTPTKADRAEVIAMTRRAVERKAAGCAPYAEDMNVQMEKIRERERWHAWARKHGVPFRETEAGTLEPARMMPLDPAD